MWVTVDWVEIFISEYNIWKLLPIALVILFMIILYNNLLNTCEAELALRFHLFLELRKQVITSTFPDHHHKTAARFDYGWRKRWNAHSGTDLTQVIFSLILIHFNLITLRDVVDNNCASLCYYLERSCNFLRKFRDNQTFPIKGQWIYIFDSWKMVSTIEDRLRVCFETLVRNYH